MLESPEAIAEADAMAAVPGIDVLRIGTNDLCAEMGIPGKFGDERVAKAYDTVFSACRNNGKVPGMGGIYDEELSQKYLKLGMRLLLAGNDLGFLMADDRKSGVSGTSESGRVDLGGGRILKQKKTQTQN